MSVFQSEMVVGYASEKSPQPCKRDYEKEIARAKSAQQSSVMLSVAIEEYIKLNGRGDRQFTLTSLYGALLLEQKDMQGTVEYLQEQWEQDK